jgi:hypothetical protein
MNRNKNNLKNLKLGYKKQRESIQGCNNN